MGHRAVLGLLVVAAVAASCGTTLLRAKDGCTVEVSPP
jgi:hypothetical protein